jgi:peptidoglycan/LPS O-acetylase OafA/YrhL
LGVLRLVLALSVVMSHGLTTFVGITLFEGAGAVWTFFAISGFLITVALHSKYASGEGHLARFYWNRVIRLYPAYWVWLVLTIAAYLLIPPALLTYQRFVVDGSAQASGFWADHAHGASGGALAVAAFANMTGFLFDALRYLVFDKATGAMVANPRQDAPVWAMGFMFVGQFWSIGVELCFYALAPLLARHMWRIAVLFALSASGFLEQAWVRLGTWADFPAAFTYLQAPRFLWMFMVGAMLAHAFLLAQAANRKKLWQPIVLLLLMYAYVASRGQALFPMPTFPWWLFAAMTGAVPLLFAKTASNKLDRFAGDLSYPVYINHFIVIQVVGSFVGPNGLLFAVVSILLAMATLILVERPARLLKATARPQGTLSHAS